VLEDRMNVVTTNIREWSRLVSQDAAIGDAVRQDAPVLQY